MSLLDRPLATWLDAHADSLYQDASQADALLALLASNGLFKHGGPESAGTSALNIAARWRPARSRQQELQISPAGSKLTKMCQ